MKYSVVLCLLAVVLIQQCMSAHVHHEGEKNDEDHMSHERGDHKGHKHEDHTGHNHGLFGDPIYDNPKYYDNPIYDIGFDGIRGIHDRKDLLLEKFRKVPLGYQ
ncbi:uncharacterized protein LOC132937198 [Metopolophium dirhodum]|uniref:uncharacterized protein LOC132937198 n=1 Tax=Metopolophium dirhodum TaxID=44670 RepID=UPI00298FAF6A|nr:uncharacterized protein LOC132937198 [Metopolophium dirhodum]